MGCRLDSEYAHRAWIENGLGELRIPLVSDITKRIARDYGALIEAEGIATARPSSSIPRESCRYACYQTPPSGGSVSETLRVLRRSSGGEVPGRLAPGAKTLGR